MTDRPPAPPTPGLSRRRLLRQAGLGAAGLTAGVALAACSEAAEVPGAHAADAGDLDPQLDGLREVTGLRLGENDIRLSVAIASAELLTGPTRIPFGVFTFGREPVPDAALHVWLVREDDNTVVAETTEPIFYDEDLGDRGVYVLTADVPRPGRHLLLVDTDAGEGGSGAAFLNLVAPENAIVPVPGESFPSLRTPVEEVDLGVERICTNNPPCPMHDNSLDESLAAGRKVVLSIATPAFCSSAICAPTITVLTNLREELARDDIDWIHAEVFSDAGETPAPYITELGLPSEPWTWLIDGDGVVVDRFDGPLVPSLFRQALDTL